MRVWRHACRALSGAHWYEASSRVLCSSEKVTLRARFQPPLPGTRPDDSSALLSFHVCQTWHLSAHAHRCCQHVTIFSDTSHSQVRRSLSTRCRQPPWNVHTLFHSPVSNPSTFFPINFLEQLWIWFVEAVPWWDPDHRRSSVSRKASWRTLRRKHKHVCIRSVEKYRQSTCTRNDCTSCFSCLQQADPLLMSLSASRPLFQLSSWESANPTV